MRAVASTFEAAKPLTLTLAAAGLLGLSACGNTDLERGTTGGAIGGAAGYAVGAPVIGAAAGAATGAISDQDEVDLGQPIWEWD
jgi:hypothetical protein